MSVLWRLVHRGGNWSDMGIRSGTILCCQTCGVIRPVKCWAVAMKMFWTAAVTKEPQIFCSHFAPAKHPQNILLHYLSLIILRRVMGGGRGECGGGGGDFSLNKLFRATEISSLRSSTIWLQTVISKLAQGHSPKSPKWYFLIGLWNFFFLPSLSFASSFVLQYLQSTLRETNKRPAKDYIQCFDRPILSPTCCFLAHWDWCYVTLLCLPLLLRISPSAQWI